MFNNNWSKLYDFTPAAGETTWSLLPEVMININLVGNFALFSKSHCEVFVYVMYISADPPPPPFLWGGGGGSGLD